MKQITEAVNQLRRELLTLQQNQPDLLLDRRGSYGFIFENGACYLDISRERIVVTESPIPVSVTIQIDFETFYESCLKQNRFESLFHSGALGISGTFNLLSRLTTLFDFKQDS